MESDLDPAGILMLRRAAQAFGIHQDFSPIGNGNINDTYLSEDGKYVLQRINNAVFKVPGALMDNIALVTEHLRKKSLLEGRDPNSCVLHFLQTAEQGCSEQADVPVNRQKNSLYNKQGSRLFTKLDGSYYRMMFFVPDTTVVDPEHCKSWELRECGFGFGNFLRSLQDLDARLLKETIPDFHNTAKRFENLQKAAEEDLFGRTSFAKDDLVFAFSCKACVSRITDGLEKGNIPLCITHNDTKISNILFDAKTKKARCVIDLDTVMPGSRLYDYGDALRTAAASAKEDEEDLTKVDVDMDAFEAFTAGFLEGMGEALTLEERKLMPFSFFLMTYECGIRFLEDFLRGDVYFKTARSDHNLIRAKNQLTLARKIMERQKEMEAVIRRLEG